MSFSAPDQMSLAATTPASLTAGSGLQATAADEIPASVRRQGSKATSAYAEGLAFEQVLTNQLTSTLTGTLTGSEPSAYSSLIPQALTQSLMSNGGVGVARELAQTIDPALDEPETAGTH